MKKYSPHILRRGAALVVVLSIVVLVTILVVGLTLAMRMERSASHFHLERVRADLMARTGVDYGQALLRSATESTNIFWVSAPGRIITFDPVAGHSNVWLSSGFTNASGYSTSSNSAEAVDLNRPGLDNPSDRIMDPRIEGEGGLGAFPMRWIYVNRDGSLVEQVSTNAVGRFAFWMDDESTRVNLNTAATRTPETFSWQGHPRQVSLKGLPYGMASSAVYNAVIQESTNNQFNTPYTSPYDIMGRDRTKAHTNVLFSNRFLLSHYNHVPDVNPWGEPKITLTTREERSLTTDRYLDVLLDETKPANRLSNLETNRLVDVHAELVSYLQRKDWPYAQGSSFKDKYGERGVGQMALDIIEYARVADTPFSSANPLAFFAEAIVARDPTDLSTLLPGDDSLASIPAGAAIGTTRRPMLAQVGVYTGTNYNTTDNVYLGNVHAQFYFPRTHFGAGYGKTAETHPSYTYQMRLELESQGVVVMAWTNKVIVGTGTRNEQWGQDDLHKVVFSDVPITAQGPNEASTNVNIRLQLLTPSAVPTAPVISNIIEIAPLAGTDWIPCRTGMDKMGYAYVNDPRLNKDALQWDSTETSDGTNFHSQRVVDFNRPSSDGANADKALFFPGNAGPGVCSIGELGHLATGVGTVPPVPWRTLRLRKGSSPNTNTVPDWALLDLFAPWISLGSTAVATWERNRYAPGLNIAAGRVNVNGLIGDNANPSRTNVLGALLADTVLSNKIDEVSENIINVRLGSGGLNYGGAEEGKYLVSVGQLAEVDGVTDANDEASEKIMRQIASMSAVRGNVFSVYSVGQALQVSLAGKVTVTGEKILRVMVERYYDETGLVKFRILSSNDVFP